jgi:hypothetical protein
MERAERAALYIFASGIGVAMVAAAVPLAFPEAPKILWQVLFCLGAIVALCPAFFLAYEYREIARAKRSVPLIGMIISGVAFIAFAAWYFWPDHGSTPPAQAAVVPTTAAPVPKPTSQPDDLRRFVLDGLTKARADLLSIQKVDLSCAALDAWQARADAATRLAHANGIQIHNPISQLLAACKNTTDPELLEALRGGIVKLLDQGIQAARG